jgi:lipopolysaccharide/colanic/teichoic acid biosynthesis glycosyltransferase
MTYHFVKRLIDICLAVILGIFFFPICLITALAIKFDSTGPVMADTPPRVGQGGKPFKLYKFRSMIVGAHDLLRNDPRFKKLYEEYKRSSFKLHNDPRWTRVGQFIRKYSIDEFPQFINVLRGEMSIVGPRPYYPDELEEQQKKYPQTIELVKEVLSVKPGITGEWQVSGRSEINFDKRIAMDANYARKKSLWYDIVILCKTPWAMITGSGAV